TRRRVDGDRRRRARLDVAGLDVEGVDVEGVDGGALVGEGDGDRGDGRGGGRGRGELEVLQVDGRRLGLTAGGPRRMLGVAGWSSATAGHHVQRPHHPRFLVTGNGAVVLVVAGRRVDRNRFR